MSDRKRKRKPKDIQKEKAEVASQIRDMVVSRFREALVGLPDMKSDALWEVMEILQIRKDELDPAQIPITVSRLNGMTLRSTVIAVGLMAMVIESQEKVPGIKKLEPKRASQIIEKAKALIEANEAFGQEVAAWLVKD